MSTKLSVVVPMYNVEDYLAECLESIAAQTLRDLEVIMVDDGSPDGSARIAQAFADRDPRFRLVRKENGGLGPARNTGTEHATGEYLAFVDSDDRVPSYAYEKMVNSLEETGSDLCCGGVERFDSERVLPAKFLQDTFRTARARTHVSRDHLLLRDRTAWNKVFRRSFWDRYSYAFPPGAYEDIPVTIPAHVQARSVDVLRDIVYSYRQREGGELSITQRRTEASNLQSRIESCAKVSRFLAKESPELKDVYDLATLDDDLMIFIDAVENGDDEYRARLCEQIGAYVGTMRPGLVDRLPALQRLKYHLLLAGRGDDLAVVHEYERTGLPAVPTVSRGLLRKRWYAGYPFRDDPERAIPESVYDVTDELGFHAQADTITWVGDKLRITGHAYVPGIDMSLDDEITVWLRHVKSGREHRPALRRVAVPEVTALSKQASACYDGSGFVIELDPAELKNGHKGADADWQLHAKVRVGSGRDRLVRSGRIMENGPAAQWPRYRDLPGGVRVQCVRAGENGVRVRFRRPVAMVTGQTWTDESIVFTGWVRGNTENADIALVACRERGTEHELPLSYGAAADGRTPFSLAVPLELIGARADDAVENLNHDLSLRVRGKRVRLSVPDDFTETAYSWADKAVVIGRTRFGNFTLTVGIPQLLVSDVVWRDDELVLTGVFAGDAAYVARPETLVLRRRRGGERYEVPIAWDGERFEIAFRPGFMRHHAELVAMHTGRWDMWALDGTGSRVALLAGRSCFDALPNYADHNGFRYRMWPSRGLGLYLSSQVARPDDERGPYARRMLQEREYPAFRRNPVRDLVTFESYFGWQYSCNPKAIYEEFRRRDTGYELVWVKGERHFNVPDGGRTVQRFSREYYELTAAARFVVNNAAQPTCYRPRDGQLYVQTWHGTPIKTIGFDMLWDKMERRDQRQRELADDISRWGLLLSQNPMSTKVMRRAFRYDGEILESGYPRNDIAHQPGAEAIRTRLREELGIPPWKRAVLFAPTWRDNLRSTGEGLARHQLGLDIERAAAALGHDTVLLLRMHHMLNAQLPSGLNSFVVDVTDYPDITELFIASDAMITDYSSAMCDYAGLGKPIMLFTPDLEAYRNDIRGFTLDIVEHAPGPILRTSDEVIEALREFDAVAAESADQLALFAKDFCPFDDGHAAERVVDYLLSR
ncbi:bifunctional glycosyltransferase/CDP-glycerol:glycerophosphate glycerophosphotransferase [Actinomadura rayongensis]|uniref:Glycosyltransferase n=1 Tax=Actinomadura rayongensis TaxID=1429076 RepID=A0A6I4W3B9_9ACTN|nr:bifunctional glycosyltransferase family 2 protein/CDP-glycerol:glycerophosphate glycerophosphotransferase [Actinomadura rayongensis]MXQ62726.1 glycosyltransferase [Actinomadura rayongensis]